MCLLFFGSKAWAQTAIEGAPDSIDTPADSNPAPMTPMQQREKAIQGVDPLYREEKAGKDKAARQATKRVEESQEQTPGSIAADNADNKASSSRQSGPEVSENAASDAGPEYYGPGVLNRSYSIYQPAIPKSLKWTETLGVSSSFETGAAQGTNSGAAGSAEKSSGAMQGTAIAWGLSGGRAFGHYQFGMNYSGSMTYYPASSFYTGANHNMGLTFSRAISRRFSLGVKAVASDVSANATLQNLNAGPETIANVSLATSPGIAIVDTGSKQYTAGVNLHWQLTGRTAFTFTGSDFATVRNSAALYGVTGKQAGVNGTYRLTRKMTVGGSYSYSNYVYPHGTGVSDTHSVGLIFSYAIDRSTQLRFNGGLSRVESLGLQTVPLSPEVAVLLGETSGIIDAYRVIRSSDLSAQAIRDFHKYGTVSFAYARGVTPGNGLFQTSQQESLSVSGSRKIFRDYGLSVGGGRDRLISVSQSLGQYATEFATLSLSRSYKKGVGVSLSASYHHVDIQSTSSLKNQLTINSGLSWSSARLWPF
ncbi:MAG: hypothetical protein M3N93_04745 [Acidobacteriota bacterium]|nr:hypothetical protein [Acidobacteriota bacterium]